MQDSSYFTSSRKDYTESVTFPKAFSSRPTVVLALKGIDQTSSGTEDWYAWDMDAESVTTTGFTAAIVLKDRKIDKFYVSYIACAWFTKSDRIINRKSNPISIHYTLNEYKFSHQMIYWTFFSFWTVIAFTVFPFSVSVGCSVIYGTTALGLGLGLLEKAKRICEIGFRGCLSNSRI